MNTELNIVARRIFNRLDVDISDRRGLGNEWEQISPNVKNVEIRSAWEQIITEEVGNLTGAQQPKVGEPTKTEVDAEDWLKATSVELCRVADHFLALRKDADRVDAAAVEIVDSTVKLEQENVELRARVKRLEEALIAYQEAYTPDGHVAPHDCFSTGPKTGHGFQDHVWCPGCYAASKAKESKP